MNNKCKEKTYEVIAGIIVIGYLWLLGAVAAGFIYFMLKLIT